MRSGLHGRQDMDMDSFFWQGGWIARCILGAALLLVACTAIYGPTKPDEPPQYCTVFNHMVKSGGTSIKQQMVHSSVVQGHARPGLCTVGITATSDLCRDALFNSSVIMGYGELLRHPLEERGRDCKYFTMMRHPISRLVSAFYYCPEDHDKHTPRPHKWCGNLEHPEPATARLLDFALNTKWGYMSYAEMMFGIYCSKGFDLCEPQYQVADKPHGIDTQIGRDALTKMEGILSSYTAVGIFEEWALSMKLFNATVTSSVRNWDATVVLNGGIMPGGRAELLEWALLSPEINAVLAADLTLYHFAVLLFRHQTSTILGKEWDY